MAQKSSKSAKSTTASKGRSTAKSASSKKAQKKRSSSERVAIEIFGIVLVAIGALFGVYLYSGSDSWLGTVLSSFLLGMTGMFAYVVPVIFILLGFFVILSGRQRRSHGSYATALIALYCIVCIFHLASSTALTSMHPYGTEGYTFSDYVKEFFAQFPAAWQDGVQNHSGGGVLGMLLTSFLYVCGGKLLCWIVLIAGLLVCVLLLTGISIKAYTDAFGSKVKAKIEEIDANKDVWEEDEPTPEQPKKKPWNPEFNRPMDFEEEDEPKHSLHRHKEIPFDERFTVPEPEPQKPAKKSAPKPKAGDPEFMPSTGRLSVASEPIAPVEAPLPAEPKAPVKKTTEPKPAEKSAPSDADDLPLVIPEAEPIPMYLPPSIECLNKPRETFARSTESPAATAKLLEETLSNFNISAKVVNISVGPVVTRYELQPAPGVRVSRITALSNDIALSLAAQRVRIEAPIPGKAAVGIEVPNKDTATVLLRDIIESEEFERAKSPVTMALGKDIAGKTVVADLGKMPHMLIAGSTGSGKSVCINDLIISMIYKSSPKDLQLILIDPKMVELSVFGTLPHLLIPVVTEPKKAASALRWATNEMTVRYQKFTEVGARDLARYNSVVEDPKKQLPKLVIIIDELADLMMVAPDDVEDSICRIAQLGRAAGIHLIVATQRPSADIITGLIKANIPSRCAFAVSSAIDSRIILDATGAEKLLGRGDMLFHPNGAGKPTRLQCAYVSDEEVERVMSHFKKEETAFDNSIVQAINDEAKGGAQGGVFGEGKQEDELLGEAVRIVLENGQASISMIQRRLRVGYARAARLVDMMEQNKYVSGFDGSKPRQVLITQAEYNRIFGGGMDPEPDPIDLDEPPFEEDPIS